jgi:hypothetical protein
MNSTQYNKGWFDALNGVTHQDGKGEAYDQGFADSYAQQEQLANTGVLL